MGNVVINIPGDRCLPRWRAFVRPYLVSGWFWAFTFLLVILWVVVMCVVFPPIRDYILTYQWAAISFVITFILKGQILTPKLYNKKASDGKIITFRRRRLFF